MTIYKSRDDVKFKSYETNPTSGRSDHSRKRGLRRTAGPSLHSSRFQNRCNLNHVADDQMEVTQERQPFNRVSGAAGGGVEVKGGFSGDNGTNMNTWRRLNRDVTFKKEASVVDIKDMDMDLIRNGTLQRDGIQEKGKRKVVVETDSSSSDESDHSDDSSSESEMDDPIRRCIAQTGTKSIVKAFLSSSESDSSSSSSSEDDMADSSRCGLGKNWKNEVFKVYPSSNEIGHIYDLNRLGIAEKGKKKVIEVSSSSSDSDMEDSHMVSKIGSLMSGKIAADNVSLQQATIRTTRTGSNIGFRERFRVAARRYALRLPLFSHQNEEEEEEPRADKLQLPQTEDNVYMGDGPTRFSTASKIIRERAKSMSAQNVTSNNSRSVPLIWVPKVSPKRIKVAPSLCHLCMGVMVENSDAISSFESVPNELKQRLTHLLCGSGKLNNHFFDQLVTESPYEMHIRDCSRLNEDQFTNTLQRTDTSNLKVLQLDQCGRCLPDCVLFTTLASSPRKFSALTSISVKGACRLSDAGLNALVTSAPALTSINLGCCSLLTPDGIINLADKLGAVLKELYVDDCCGMDDKRILPALMKLQHLEVLSVSRLETVDDYFIIEFVGVHGHKMKKLVLAACTKLTDRGVKAIAENCPRLRAMDLTNLHKLTDNAIGHLANGCQEIQTMKFCRNAFSDEAVAAYLEVCGKPLRELSLNHVNKVALETALSLAKCGKKLETLDLSWCREMTNETLGLIVESCLSLKLLKLFGCTQISNVFTDGHSNEEVQIIGLKESQLLIEVADTICGIHPSV